MKELISKGESPMIDFPRFPCHTQSVERCVKLFTDASNAVCGEKSRDGFIRVRLASRNIMPNFNTQVEFHLI